MSQENDELVGRMIEWFNARDADAAQAHSTDDVEIVPLRAAMEDTIYRGPNAFAAFGADNDETWEAIRFDAETTRSAGERAVVIGRVVGRSRLTGADVSTRLALLFDFRADKISKLRTYVDVAEALEAAGLSE